MKTMKKMMTLLAVVGLVLALAPPAQATLIEDTRAAIEAGLNPGDKYHLVFLGSAERDASSTDIADYNSHVQGLATAAGSGTDLLINWFAVCSTATVDAKDNAPVLGPVYDMNGLIIADNSDKFYNTADDDAYWYGYIDFLEDGAARGDSQASLWTGTKDGGVAATAVSGNGGPLGSAIPTQGRSYAFAGFVGFPGGGADMISQGLFGANTGTLRLLGLSQAFTIPGGSTPGTLIWGQ